MSIQPRQRLNSKNRRESIRPYGLRSGERWKKSLRMGNGILRRNERRLYGKENSRPLFPSGIHGNPIQKPGEKRSALRRWEREKALNGEWRRGLLTEL